MDALIPCIPGLEKTLRRRDLPNICRSVNGLSTVEFFIEENKTFSRAAGTVINTFEDLEGPFISKLDSSIGKFYSIGPLQDPTSTSDFVSPEDSHCMEWLDSKPPHSVVYVSFGTLARLSNEQLLEFWHGLVNSGSLFLWAIRSDRLIHLITPELEKGTKERGFIVSWAPQQKLLLHKAIGGFMTHGGWNSVLESISSGVPMICWAGFFDQFVIRMCVSEMWKTGLAIDDRFDRLTIEKSVRRLMESDDKDDEVRRSSEKMAAMAHKSVQKGGSSYLNLERLVDDIKKMKSAKISVMEEISVGGN